MMFSVNILQAEATSQHNHHPLAYPPSTQMAARSGNHASETGSSLGSATSILEAFSSRLLEGSFQTWQE